MTSITLHFLNVGRLTSTLKESFTGNVTVSYDYKNREGRNEAIIEGVAKVAQQCGLFDVQVEYDDSTNVGTIYANGRPAGSFKVVATEVLPCANCGRTDVPLLPNGLCKPCIGRL